MQREDPSSMAFVDYIPLNREQQQQQKGSSFTRFPAFHHPTLSDMVPRGLAPPSTGPPSGPSPLSTALGNALYPSFQPPGPTICPHCQFTSYSVGGVCMSCNMPLPPPPPPAATISPTSLLRGPPVNQLSGPLGLPRPQSHAYKDADVLTMPLYPSSVLGRRGLHHDRHDNSSADPFMMSSIKNAVDNLLEEQDGGKPGVGMATTSAINRNGEEDDINNTLPLFSNANLMSPNLAYPSLVPLSRYTRGDEHSSLMQGSLAYPAPPPVPLTSTRGGGGGGEERSYGPDVSSVKVNQSCHCGVDHIAFSIDCQDFIGSNSTTTTTTSSSSSSSVPALKPLPLPLQPPIPPLDPLAITPSPSSSLPSSRRTSPPNNGSQLDTPLPSFEEGDLESCETHKDEKLAYFCPPCMTLVCKTCLGIDHAHHNPLPLRDAYLHFKPNLKELLGKTQVEVDLLKESLSETKKMRQRVSEKQQEAIAEVQAIFKTHKEEILKQEQEVLSQINEIAKLRIASLSNDEEKISQALDSAHSLSNAAEGTLQLEDGGGKSGRILVSHSKLRGQMKGWRQFTSSSSPLEDDSFVLKSNPAGMISSLKSLCVLTTAPYPPLCTAMGEGLFHPRVNKLCTVILVAKDRSGEPCVEGGERLFILLRSTGGVSVPVDFRDNSDGTYSINFRPQVKGDHQLVIAIRGQHVKGSPFSLYVDGGREYGRFGVLTQVFGSEGSQNGQFSRPWGICCDQQGNIIVGDRSNHRIQVFDSNGTFKHKFGSEGVRPGQFNRPAGVAVTREGHVVVADKDNHRIQVLKIDGSFLFVFGSKGGNDGQMIYPYDVAVNQLDGRIAVTDTGNHRLLIFSFDGILLGKFGYKGYLCGHFDSPRGIAFNDDGHIIVSDFNVHHILVIHPDGTTARILGSQGSGNGQFMRPQGIAVDNMGNFIVADTRNNRIVVMHSSGHVVAKFGDSGTAPGQFDRPTSVAVLPDGRVAVVDFGNSRIQIF